MEPSPSSRQGYSAFFASGLRAVARRTKISASKSLDLGGHDRSSFWSDGHFENQSHNTLFARRRHNSLSVGDKVTNNDNTKKRRSLMAFPTRLFSLMSFTSAPATRSLPSIDYQKPNQESFRGHSSDIGQSPSVGRPPSSSPAPEGRPIFETFSSWWDTDSLVIDSLPCSKVEERRESFLSLDSYSSNSSSVVLPRQERYTFLSISTSSQSSLSSLHRRDSSQRKFDVLRNREIDEEEGAPIQRQAIVDSEGYDAPAGIDWRQFHNDLLQNDSHMNY